MQQDEVIADFLRNFMGNDCQSSDDAELRTLQEGCSNEDAIDKVMKGIADQNQQAGPAMIVSRCLRIMRFAVVMVTVAPENKFLEYKESQNAE